MSASDKIARLRELRAKATAGPWKSEVWDDYPGLRLIVSLKMERELADGIDPENAAAIVAAMNSLPALLECAEALQELLAYGSHPKSTRYEMAADKARAALQALAEGGGE